MRDQKIVNVAVIAHVDAGKSTLVDAILKQTGVFRENQQVVAQVMDSNDLERERGITIYSKNCAVMYKDIKINVVDTPGHADFSSEVERIMKTVDTVILIVDSSEGPMPQTRVVLEKSLAQGHKPILFINKIDKPDARPEWVTDQVFDLFVSLNANDDQLDFPIVYGIAKDGIAMESLDQDSKDISPLFEVVLKHVPVYPNRNDEPLQMQISSLKYDNYLGRMGTARVTRGILKDKETVSVIKQDGTKTKFKISKAYTNQGLSQVEASEVFSGDIVNIAGYADITIGDTICAVGHEEAMEKLDIEEPTLSMNFLVNDSPFGGKVGKFVTSRQIRDRLDKELETNVGLRVEDLPGTDGFKVSGRGELHLSVLLENMRREGFEIGVTKPQVEMKKIDGVKSEPYELAQVSVPEEFASTIINHLQLRKGEMRAMETNNGFTRLEFLIPTRGLIGYRNDFITATRGEGSLEKSFHSYGPYAGAVESRKNGVFISMENGDAMGYSIMGLSERGTMFIEPAQKVYVGMIVGMNSRDNDLTVNPCKNKKLTNVRASGSDQAISLNKPRRFTLEEALEFIEPDELVEITPDAIRLRKIHLDERDRKRAAVGKDLIPDSMKK